MIHFYKNKKVFVVPKTGTNRVINYYLLREKMLFFSIAIVQKKRQGPITTAIADYSIK